MIFVRNEHSRKVCFIFRCMSRLDKIYIAGDQNIDDLAMIAEVVTSIQCYVIDKKYY